MDQGPTTIGRYKVLGQLGQGAMGRVYLAEDPLLKRSVAIKVVHGWAGGQDDYLSRFRREAEISAQLNHPNVITIFDVGEEAGLGPFLAMERVDGPSLQEMLKEGPLEPDRAMPIIVQAALALEAAHAAGIVHRDLKPANLLVDKSGRVKLMDFGIARRQEGAQTSTGLLCTPCYAAPELLARESSSAATDRWAFAVTACQCMTQRLPYDGENLSAILYAVAHQEPSFPDSMAPEVQAVFRRALAKDPAERHADLRSFVEELLAKVQLGEEARLHCRGLLDASHALGATGQVTVPLERRPAAGLPAKWVLLGLGGAAAVALAFLVPGRFPGRRLSVDSRPQGAMVWLDGRPLGQTPLKGRRVARSARLVKVEKEGFQAWEREVGPDERELVVTLEARPLSLDFTSEPQGAEVFLDGVLRGITPVKGLQVPGEGVHRLMVRKPGYEAWSMQASQQNRPPERVRLRKETKAGPPKKEEPGFWKRLFGGKGK